MSAACVRAKMFIDEGSADGKESVELADLFCRAARRRVTASFHELWHNDDDQNYGAAQLVLDGRYAWAEDGVLDPSLLAALLDALAARVAE